jgi:GNAT superfamily N-acetyltransferase
MEKFVLKEVLTKRDLKQFVLFPFSLYKENPYWVPPLYLDEMSTLDKNKNPAFEYCEAKYWLAYKNGEIVGRIAGIINHAYIEKWKNKFVRFGWIDFIDEPAVSRLLLETVEKWAIESGLNGIHGPLGFTDFDPEGMLVDGFEESGTMTTIYNYPYYPSHLENLGYKKDVDWLEYEITIPQQIPDRIKRAAVAVAKRYDLHSLKVRKAKDLLLYSRNLFEVLNLTYKDLYGVVALSEKQISEYTKQYFSFIQPEYVSVVLDKNEKVAAFAISIPSLSKALQKAKGKILPVGFIHLYRALKKNNIADLYLVAVRPDFQSKGLNAILINDLGTTFLENGIKKAITHPALEKNNKVLTLWKDYETRFIKRRRCFLKILKNHNPFPI